jgi:hypothetical protein
MALPSSILAGILLFSLPNPTLAQKDNGDECSCFRTNGSSEGYFAYHRFHDFRNVANASATPPTVLANMANATNALATSDFFLSGNWTNDWTVQNWNNSDSFVESGATVLMINSPNNVYIGIPLPPQFCLKYLNIRRTKHRQLPRLLLLPHLPYLPPPRLPIRRTNRLERAKLPIPLRPLQRPRHRLPRCLRRNVHLSSQR